LCSTLFSRLVCARLRERTAGVCGAYQRKKLAGIQLENLSLLWSESKPTKIDTNRAFVDLVSHVGGCEMF
jgi:hypothetical protein